MSYRLKHFLVLLFILLVSGVLGYINSTTGSVGPVNPNKGLGFIVSLPVALILVGLGTRSFILFLFGDPTK